MRCTRRSRFPLSGTRWNQGEISGSGCDPVLTVSLEFFYLYLKYVYPVTEGF